MLQIVESLDNNAGNGPREETIIGTAFPAASGTTPVSEPSAPVGRTLHRVRKP